MYIFQSSVQQLNKNGTQNCEKGCKIWYKIVFFDNFLA